MGRGLPTVTTTSLYPDSPALQEGRKIDEKITDHINHAQAHALLTWHHYYRDELGEIQSRAQCHHGTQCQAAKSLEKKGGTSEGNEHLLSTCNPVRRRGSLARKRYPHCERVCHELTMMVSSDGTLCLKTHWICDLKIVTPVGGRTRRETSR